MKDSGAEKPPNNPSRTHLRVREAAEQLGLSELAVRRFIWSKELRVTHLGRSVRIPREELDRFLASRTR
jgi:excisionase family DNA binding protein